MDTFKVNPMEFASVEDVLKQMKKREPILIKNWDIGPCTDLWTSDYISRNVGNEQVKIHVSKEKKLDFITKNFLYKTLPFDELIKRIFLSHQENYFLHRDEVYYFRSLGTNPRGKDVSNFLQQYPSLSNDFKVPPFFDEKDYFSCVFRASSKGLQLWTHYDIMDNILVQITGVKNIVLWPPYEIDKMYLIGDKSQVLDVNTTDLTKYPKFKNAIRFQCILYPGDILFIPALWFHNVVAEEPSLGLNIFWKNLSHEFYDKNDTYGNKDLLPATKGLHAINSAIKSLNCLPADYKNFYIHRMINLLENNLS